MVGLKELEDETGTGAAVAGRIADALAHSVRDDFESSGDDDEPAGLMPADIRAKLLASGAVPADDPSGQYLSGVIRTEYDKYGALLKAMNILPE